MVRLLLRALSACPLLRPGPAKAERDGLVALVARVLEHLIALVAGQRHGKPPGRCEHVRVVDGHVVADRVGADAREVFNEVQGLAVGYATEASGSGVSRDPSPVVEIRR